MQSLKNSHVSHVYDLTLSYRRFGSEFGSVPNVLRSFTGDLSHEYEFHVHVKRFPVKELPIDDEKALADWLRQRFQEKDQWLDRMKIEWTAGLELRSEP